MSRSVLTRLLAGVVILAAVSGQRTEAQADPADGLTGCTLQKQVYTCDRAQFHQALARAVTAQVDPVAEGKDRMMAAKLRDLIVALGKRTPEPERAADLSFSIIPVDSAGVIIGPAGVELAVLRVYGAPARTGPGTTDDGTGKGPLLWAESFTGQPDLSWPATVQATINQFRAGLKR